MIAPLITVTCPVQELEHELLEWQRVEDERRAQGDPSPDAPEEEPMQAAPQAAAPRAAASAPAYSFGARQLSDAVRLQLVPALEADIVLPGSTSSSRTATSFDWRWCAKSLLRNMLWSWLGLGRTSRRLLRRVLRRRTSPSFGRGGCVRHGTLAASSTSTLPTGQLTCRVAASTKRSTSVPVAEARGAPPMVPRACDAVRA